MQSQKERGECEVLSPSQQQLTLASSCLPARTNWLAASVSRRVREGERDAGAGALIHTDTQTHSLILTIKFAFHDLSVQRDSRQRLCLPRCVSSHPDEEWSGSLIPCLLSPLECLSPDSREDARASQGATDFKAKNLLSFSAKNCKERSPHLFFSSGISSSQE